MPVFMKNREWIKESQPIYVQESKLWFSAKMLVWNKIYTHKLYLELWQHFSLFFRSGKDFAYILNQYLKCPFDPCRSDEVLLIFLP